jgi:serine/threonine-protein kinase RsbW
MILKLTLDLPEEQAYIKITRLLGRTLLEHLRACEQDIDELELVVGELCANVVRHARSTENHFQVFLEYHADRVDITVQDQGPGFSPREVAPVGAERPDFEGQPERIGGYGLRLVELLSDHIEFQSADPKGTTVRAEKRIHYKTPADAANAERLGSHAKGGRVTLTTSSTVAPVGAAG